MGESIMVIPAFATSEIGEGICTNLEKVNRILENDYISSMDRDLAENDQNWKQIIPYTIFVSYENGDPVFLNYTRGKSGGENRLHDKISLGIGGHVQYDGSGASDHIYHSSFLREIEEELGNPLPPESSHFVVAAINDNSNDVGKVHIGIVHMVFVQEEHRSSLFANEDAIQNLKFSSLSEIKENYDRLENWSKIIIDADIL